MNKIKNKFETILELSEDFDDLTRDINFFRELLTDNLIHQLKIKIRLELLSSFKINKKNNVKLSQLYLEEFIHSLRGNINLVEKIIQLEEKIKLLKLSLIFFVDKKRKKEMKKRNP
jgi:hypothetical protein